MLTGNEMDDYAKARYKDTQQLTILKFIDDNGKMNPDISEVDFIQDGDLNKSLQHFVSCKALYSVWLSLTNPVA